MIVYSIVIYGRNFYEQPLSLLINDFRTGLRKPSIPTFKANGWRAQMICKHSTLIFSLQEFKKKQESFNHNLVRT